MQNGSRDFVLLRAQYSGSKITTTNKPRDFGTERPNFMVSSKKTVWRQQSTHVTIHVGRRLLDLDVQKPHVITRFVVQKQNTPEQDEAEISITQEMHNSQSLLNTNGPEELSALFVLKNYR